MQELIFTVSTFSAALCNQTLSHHQLQEPETADQLSKTKVKKGRTRTRTKKAATAVDDMPPASPDPAVPSTSMPDHRASKAGRSRSRADTSTGGPSLQHSQPGGREAQQVRQEGLQMDVPSDLPPVKQKQDGEQKGRIRQNQVGGRGKQLQPISRSTQPGQASSSSAPPADLNAPTSQAEPAQRKSRRQRSRPRDTSKNQPSSTNPEAEKSLGEHATKHVQKQNGDMFIPLAAPPGIGKGAGQGHNKPQEVQDDSASLPEGKSASETKQKAQGETKSKRIRKPRNKVEEGTLPAAGLCCSVVGRTLKKYWGQRLDQCMLAFRPMKTACWRSMFLSLAFCGCCQPI